MARNSLFARDEVKGDGIQLFRNQRPNARSGVALTNSPTAASSDARDPLSRAFHSVRFIYSLPGVSSSRIGRRSGHPRQSAFFGHQPPCGIPLAIAQSSAAWSAPVWPPETIFMGGSNIVGSN
jgi:hypothetical protein